jgi:V/A-type H+-transporting ATPase subunit I
MSGVVHSLRLNLIEFLSWSLTEEGRPFAPFAKKANKQ